MCPSTLFLGTLAAQFPMPGAMQTVPRGELFTLVELIRHAESSHSVHYLTDNIWVHDTFTQGLGYTKICSNSDLWRALFNELSTRHIRRKVTWMPSHLKLHEPIPEGVSTQNVHGNNSADGKAGDAAKKFALPLNVTSAVSYYYRLISKIQLRFISIVLNLPNRAKSTKQRVPLILNDPIESLISKSSHVIHRNHNRITCLRCSNSFNIKDSSLRSFLQSQCFAIGTNADKPVLVPLEIKHIGNKSTHHSHKLSSFKGLIFCTKCGMRGPTRLVNLSKPCEGPTGYGKRNLEAIFQGKLPEQLDAWPSDEGNTATHKIDRAPRIDPAELPMHFPGIRIKRPSPVFNAAGLSTSVTTEPSVSVSPESFLPPKMMNLIELITLEAEGNCVQWPQGINAKIARDLIVDFFSPMIDWVDDEPKLDSHVHDSPSNSNVGTSFTPNQEREEINDTYTDVTNPSSVASQHPAQVELSDASRDNLAELLSLSDDGENVIWPHGFNAQRARMVLHSQ